MRFLETCEFICPPMVFRANIFRTSCQCSPEEFTVSRIGGKTFWKIWGQDQFGGRRTKPHLRPVWGGRQFWEAPEPPKPPRPFRGASEPLCGLQNVWVFVLFFGLAREGQPKKQSKNPNLDPVNPRFTAGIKGIGGALGSPQVGPRPINKTV